MKSLRLCLIGCALALQCAACWAVCGVRISDLHHIPTPPNPIKVWGKVKSVSPLKISDGRAEIQVNGFTASLNDFVVVTGDWNGTVLTVAVTSTITGEMISIPAGAFSMGTPTSYTGFHYPNEHPQHSVTLGAYSIGKYEVTRAEYRKFIEADGYSTQSYWSVAGWNWRNNCDGLGLVRNEPDYWTAIQTWGSPPGAFTQTDNHPVVGVSYYEAEAYCNWAGGYLPTEAQWERAARWTGSVAYIYPWGDTWDQEKCNNGFDSLYSLFQTAPVGSYSAYPSASGCQDMAGNVWEWCKDRYKDTYYSSLPDGEWIDPQGPASGSLRVCRGGSWNYGENFVRCACRNYGNPENYNYELGFRLAR
ncbi:MAG: formylglycine-generating enzyme family protein [Armatimonadetes bacterium]|nr:formylglycine-generating enzyme family protein [Armatimonadota bacterium]